VGRNPVYLGAIFIYMMLIMGAGLSPNIGSQLACRFLAGFFGEAPFSTVGGSLADMWDPMQRLIAFPMFASKPQLDPSYGELQD
jgi:MFS family permease